MGILVIIIRSVLTSEHKILSGNTYCTEYDSNSAVELWVK